MIGGEADELTKYCNDVTEAARATNPWGVDEEQDVKIFVCRRPKMDLPTLFRTIGPHWS